MDLDFDDDDFPFILEDNANISALEVDIEGSPSLKRQKFDPKEGEEPDRQTVGRYEEHPLSVEEVKDVSPGTTRSYIPGPAGKELPPLSSPNDENNSWSWTSEHNFIQEERESHRFTPSAAWRNMHTKYCNAKSNFTSSKFDNPFNTSIADVFSSNSGMAKIEKIALMISSISSIVNGCVFLSFEDPSGRVQGTVHRSVMEKYPGLISVGNVMVLKEVSLYSPNTKARFLSIIARNVVEIIPTSM